MAPPPAKRTRIADTIKRLRTSETANGRNRAYRTRMRNQIKELRSLIASGNSAEATAKLPETVSTLHKLARKGIIHRNAAARRVSRLTLAINKIGK